MFLSIPKNVFTEEEKNEIDVAFQMIDSKIQKQQNTSVKSTIKTADISLDGVEFNASKTMGSYITIFVRTSKQFKLQTPPFIEIKTYGITDSGELKPVTAKTDGNVEFEEGMPLWIKIDYVISK